MKLWPHVKKIWRSFGPGLVTGASDNDPAGIAIYLTTGAQKGNLLLWTMPFILPFMIVLQEMSAKIGALTGCGLIGNMKRFYPRWLLGTAAFLVVLANTFNIGGDIYAMAGALNLLIPIPVGLMTILVALTTMFLIIYLKYQQIVAVFKWLSLATLAYILSFLFVHVEVWDVLRHTFIPSFSLDRSTVILLFAILGTTISPYLYFWQASEEAEELRQTHRRIRICRFRTVSQGKLDSINRDTIVGMSLSNLVSFFIIALAAATLHQAGNFDIATLRQAAEALRPLAGQWAIWLFAIGILGSGMLSIPVLAGSAAYVLSELFDWESSLDDTFDTARYFYTAMAISILTGILMPLLGITPIQALFFSGILNGLIAPILIIIIIDMASNPAIVGPHRSTVIQRGLAYSSFLFMLAGIVTLFI